MFKKEKKSEMIASGNSNNSNAIETIVGEGAVFEGTIITRTGLRVDGVIKGDIKSTCTVIVGETGEVIGKIDANQMYLAGTVFGNVTVEEKTEFVSGGYLKGDLLTGDLVIEKGASFDGCCKTHNNEAKTGAKALETTEPFKLEEVSSASDEE